jgi:hypothetical protein
MLKCYIWSIQTYGCEAWSWSAELIRRIEAAEMLVLRKILRISYIDHVINVEVLLRAGFERELRKK